MTYRWLWITYVFMHPAKKIVLLGLAILPAIAPLSAQVSRTEPRGTPAASSTKPKRALHWWERRRPAAESAAAQLQLADQLRAAGRLRSAARHYRILTYAWPNAPEAPIAQFRYAGILQQRAQHQKAFDEYQYLLDTYAGFFPYEEALEQQYAIANHIATRQKRLLFVTYQDEEEAIPMFERLVATAPAWKRTAELQFRIARIYEKNQEYESAVDAYSAFQLRFPFSPQAEAALYGHARCWKLLADRYPDDAGLRGQAIAAQQLFLNAYPHSPPAETARMYLRELQVRQADDFYRQARLYDSMARRPNDYGAQAEQLLGAAKICYQRLEKEFPESRWHASAAARLAEIESRLPADLQEAP